MEGHEKKIITARVYRQDPRAGGPARYQTYQIESRLPMTVLMALRYIFKNLDPTLSFRDYECYQGVCMSCQMMVKGKRVRACSTMVEPGDEFTVEPLPGQPLIKDLVVSFD
jgi:succinate dehydrogenase/fumarate reductase-like Fe-S protein